MDALLRLRNVSKTFGRTVAVKPVDLEIHRGDFFAILGPSGCGKTTLLRMIGGFVEPTSGTIEIAGKDVTGLGPERRPTNMVFQGYGLFPHMTVKQNIAYGLRIAGLPKPEIAERTREALALVHLEELESRMVQELSGGQQQRVALARALIMRPPVLLLDEPLAALDLKLRQAMQEELRRIHSDIGGTFVFVTHDQGEAMSLANRLGVMHEGELIQVGSPEDVYRRPKTAFVAAFVGDANILRGSRRAGVVTLDAGARFRSEGPESPVMVVVRPEAIAINQREGDSECTLRGKIGDMIFLGAHIRYSIDVGSPAPIMVQVNPGSAPPMCRGQEVLLSWTPANQTILAP
ncbi:MAG TPA: ABC transporter ATP-binding protein [Aestuariivirgaceae bacterium]|jgi:ABC-type Fe3+/spermidine/putrescine transport system ATPase subunit|nr:ABC transporter ATP-binding protein [Aestuariivirgaceae bacterium]